MRQDTEKYTGFILAITAAILWGISGACAQFLFQERGIEIDWLVTVRLLVAGGFLLVYSHFIGGSGVGAIWQTRQSRIDLILFSLMGMLAVQYTYFAAIKYSNAATGTVLQYLGPVFIALYFAVVQKRIPTAKECIAIILAFLGTVLLVSHGDLSKIQISEQALFWGVSSAIALAFYTVQPVRLLKKHDSAILVGWSMLIGGLALAWLSKPWKLAGMWDTPAIMAASFTIVFGTLIAFCFYLSAVKRIGPQKTSLLACAEPLSAAIMAVTWLKVPFGLMDWIGSVCILATIFILSGK